MADQYEHNKPLVEETGAKMEATDRGLFNFLGKKEEEKPTQAHEEHAISSEFGEKVKVSEHKEEEKKEEHRKEEKKLHRSSSSSSSSSSDEEEEVGEDGQKIKKKKKKGLKDKIKDKISGDHKKEKVEDTSVPVEKYEESEEKKGLLDKIKDKLPGGGQKKAEEVAAPASPPPAVAEHETAGKEEKGFLEKIKEKLPGYHPKTEKEKQKESH
ncbi:hypothetical protein K7X08_001663 [Anisodus acutangulus]|uniref:Dehydrin n=1 Tax=Anisodus acutangulus TaxID=402998 RepID=A0A9Q1R5G7_9SOLA|nr:hypothetical protein K7X08_001663 [Anisodus acutangulus]